VLVVITDKLAAARASCRHGKGRVTSGRGDRTGAGAVLAAIAAAQGMIETYGMT
jgi:hypothetical protein